MWDLPRPGMEPVSLVLSGRFLITRPPGKPKVPLFYDKFAIPLTSPFPELLLTLRVCPSLFSKFFLYPPLHPPLLLGFKLLESRKQPHTSSHSFNIMLNPSTPNTHWLADCLKVPVLSSSILSVPGRVTPFSP